MSMLEAAREILRLLNLVEIRGEGNLAAMSQAMSLMKGAISALEQAKEESYDRHDGQGQDVPD